ncbi:MAG TPA: copper-binding protein [Patescibacteria group bacterium]|nr:copper-binding protein [Patescibacteria group bacterium]
MRRPAALLLLLIAASPAAHAQPARWRGTGVVVAVLPAPSSLHATRPVIVLDHEPIHGLMEERMSMPFIAASADLFRDIKAGDHVAFALAETPDALLVVSLERLSPRSP